MSKRMRPSTGIGMSHFILRPACACRCCRARRAGRKPRVVESTLVAASRPMTTRRKKRSRWCLQSAGLLLLVLLLLTGLGALWDIGPLAPLLFRPTATVTIDPTGLNRQATLVITAVTGTPDAARHEVAARFVSATSPVLEARGQATPARGTLTFYNAATYSQIIAAGTVLTGADGVQVITDAPSPIPAGNPPLFGVSTVSAHALQAGSRGNITALDIHGLCCVAGVAVKNTAGFIGGQDAETYTTVRQADIDGLARPLLDMLTQDATFGVRFELRPQEWLVTIPACSPSISTDHAVGSRASWVSVTVSVTCRDEAYDQQAAWRVAESSFTQEMFTMLGANYALVGQVSTTLVGVRVADAKRGTLALSIEVGGVWVYHWSPAHLKALARSIAGAGKQEALTRLLRAAGVQAASILLSGRERTVLPADPSRITIIVRNPIP
jgi:Baseplate J-like protein